MAGLSKPRKGSKNVVRKDGKPTRREREIRNKRLHAAAVRALAPNVAPTPTRRIEDSDVDRILEELADGSTVRGTCRKLGVRPGDFYGKVLASPELELRYAHARQKQAHSFVEQNIEELEDLDEIDTAAEGANVEVAIAKHKFDVRRWLAGKFHVGAYGDRVTQVHEGGARPVEVIGRSMSPDEAARAYAETLHQSGSGGGNGNGGKS